MNPKSNTKLDEKSFEVLKKTMKSIAIANRKRHNNPTYATELPESIAIKLTNRCNLRCAHCYQWNESGYHTYMDKTLQNSDIDLGIVKKVLDETKDMKSRLYLWGGEPLIYREFHALADMLKEDPREVIICTNGICIEQHSDDLLAISDNLEFLIAVEGFREEHDAIRGKGTYDLVMEQIDLLLAKRKEGKFLGKITIHTMINEAMIPKLYDLMIAFEEKGIDMVFLCFPWYISDALSQEMDTFFQTHFSWLEMEEHKKPSWHAFKYRLNPDCVSSLVEELGRINERVWQMRIRYQPDLASHAIEDFILGGDMKEHCHHQCLALSNRMDITPDGHVSACKLFSEFYVGDLNEMSVSEIWHSEAFQKMREVINGQGLMPVCSKCNVLYLHGH